MKKKIVLMLTVIMLIGLVGVRQNGTTKIIH